MNKPIRIICIALVLFTIAVSHEQWAPALERLLGLNKKKPQIEVQKEKPDPKALVSIGGGEDFVDIKKLQSDEDGGTFSRVIPPTPAPKAKPKRRSLLSKLFGIPSPGEVEQQFKEVGAQLENQSTPSKTKYVYPETRRSLKRASKNKRLQNRYGNRKPMKSTLSPSYTKPKRKYPTPIPSRYGLREPMESSLKK